MLAVYPRLTRQYEVEALTGQFSVKCWQFTQGTRQYEVEALTGQLSIKGWQFTQGTRQYEVEALTGQLSVRILLLGGVSVFCSSGTEVRPYYKCHKHASP